MQEYKKKGNERAYYRNYMKQARQQKHYQKYSDRYNEKIVARRNEFKQMAVELKGGVCSVCGGIFDNVCFDFHHVDHSEKKFDIASSLTNKAWIQIKHELEKCILVCSNCHRVIHKNDGWSHLKGNNQKKESDQKTLF